MTCDTTKSPTLTPHAPVIRIRGVGLVSPFGIGAWPTFTALLQGKTLIDRIDPYQDYPDNIALIRALGAVGAAQHTRTDPTVELAERAAREALNDAKLDTHPTPPRSPPQPPHPTPIPLIIATSKGAITALARATHAHQHGQLSPLLSPDDAQILALGPYAYLTHHLTRRLWPRHTPYHPTHHPIIEHHVAACASGLTALHRARQLLLHSDHTRVLVVAADAPLLPLLIHSYDRLGVLTPTPPHSPPPPHIPPHHAPTPTTTRHPPHPYAGRPLDDARHGFMLSDLAAAVVLEKTDADSADATGGLALLDTAIASDPYDMIRPSPTMPTLGRVAQQLFADRTIDLLHPHAPGTHDHDPAELAIYHDLQPINDAYAFKGALGHGLGAAGLVAFVIACLCHRTQKRPPMPWLENPIHPAITREFSPHPINTQAIFTAGFAGHVAGAVIGRV